jgi:ubiquitin carboxyl-terminal hydrolase 9/24
MQYHVPRGFWRQFRLFGERVNLREQHDAVEFYNSILDCIDEATKSINLPQICSQVLGGIFADQKICKDCPHRYSREESFTLLSLDVKHSQRLTESLEQYVKGDLLEGANAYYCEKCDKKVDTIKRTCIKKLPSVLAIQLKRFDYDWERETAVKSNEYFEFPRELDMEPYTVSGVARSESKASSKSKNDVSINEDNSISSPASDELSNEPVNTNLYKLVGIVVHSGQANGGHYYSYIQHQGEDGEYRWYKFDDNDVSECKMDDEEMKNQCYGGDYSGEVYDNIMKRMAYKKQKRWWNAYILFYEKIENNLNKTANNEIIEHENKNECTQGGNSSNKVDVKIPNYILKSVYKKNMKFLHNRMHFSLEYFQFMKRLSQCNFYLCQNDTISVSVFQHFL